MESVVLFEAFLLFVAPGPTNALLLAGSVKGHRTLTLLTAQGCGYGIAAACWFSLRPWMLPGAIETLKLIAALWLAVLGLRLFIRARISMPRAGGGISVLTTSTINPKAFIYCLAIVPVDSGSRALGVYWVVLLLITLATGSVWVLLGKRLSDDGSLADRVAGRGACCVRASAGTTLMQFSATQQEWRKRQRPRQPTLIRKRAIRRMVRQWTGYAQ
ncbi:MULTISPECIES: hypothetical protein [unclassified Mesorhizobium]|uniref:hypothetical protein n=1 Tax=unclassified Mesorhizobium TaxID=325217 RepID=UPI001FEDD969|nr:MULTISPECIES: hypothetical protein [unclassified Mesorhizobium]